MASSLFTIITPALNCRELLPRNIASVRAQRLTNQIEHWVIDGGSKDGTVEFLQTQPDVRFISEKDNGLSNAVNKGIQRATGEWIIWLNADDELAVNALSEFLKLVRQFPNTYVFSGSQKLFGYDGSLERISEGWDYNLKDRSAGAPQSSRRLRLCIGLCMRRLAFWMRAVGMRWITSGRSVRCIISVASLCQLC